MPLEITIPAATLFNEATEEVIQTKETTLVLENSLIALSKWETKWHKPFLLSEDDSVRMDERAITQEEYLDYIRCMSLNKHVDPNVYYALTKDNLAAIDKYLSDPMTATVIHDSGPQKGTRRQSRFITSELIYCWLTSLQIPFEVEKWPLPRLIMLIKVCNEENKPKEKMSRTDQYKQNRALNEARRKKYHSKG